MTVLPEKPLARSRLISRSSSSTSSRTSWRCSRRRRGVLERRLAQLALEQPVVAAEVLPDRAADDVVAAPGEGVEDVGEHVPDDGDVPDRRVAVAPQPEQAAQVGAADPHRQHPLAGGVEQPAHTGEVLLAALGPGEVLVLEHRHGVQPAAADRPGLLDGLQPGLALRPGPELGQDEAGEPRGGVPGLAGHGDDLLRACGPARTAAAGGRGRAPGAAPRRRWPAPRPPRRAGPSPPGTTRRWWCRSRPRAGRRRAGRDGCRGCRAWRPGRAPGCPGRRRAARAAAGRRTGPRAGRRRRKAKCCTDGPPRPGRSATCARGASPCPSRRRGPARPAPRRCTSPRG